MKGISISFLILPLTILTFCSPAFPFCSVTDYGAVPDDLIDDSVAFNAAFTEGGFVFVPKGTYYIRHPLHIPDGIILWGENRRFTVLVVEGPEDKAIEIEGENVSLCNLIIQNVSANIGIYSNNKPRLCIQNCYILNFRIAGIYIEGVEYGGYSHISDSYIGGNRIGVVIMTNEVTISRCRFQSNEVFGVWIFHPSFQLSNVFVFDSIFETEERAIYSNAVNTVIFFNRFEKVNIMAVWVGESARVILGYNYYSGVARKVVSLGGEWKDLDEEEQEH